jgi:hypothetical protein
MTSPGHGLLRPVCQSHEQQQRASGGGSPAMPVLVLVLVLLPVCLSGRSAHDAPG